MITLNLNDNELFILENILDDKCKELSTKYIEILCNRDSYIYDKNSRGQYINEMSLIHNRFIGVQSLYLKILELEEKK